MPASQMTLDQFVSDLLHALDMMNKSIETQTLAITALRHGMGEALLDVEKVLSAVASLLHDLR